MTRHEAVLNDAIMRCDDGPAKDGKFMQMYPFTTENIAAYIKYFDLEGKSLLTVGSSGDQAINAILKGAKDITIFDINPYVRYYYYFKAASIMALTREEFYDLFFGFFVEDDFEDSVFNRELFEKVMPVLKEIDPKSYEFWATLFSRFTPFKIQSRLFYVARTGCGGMVRVSPYLTEEGYEITKNNIGNTHITFVNQNVLSPKINRTYDNIWLSNISSKIDETKIRRMFLKMEQYLNRGGQMLYSYIYGPFGTQKGWENSHLNIVESEAKEYPLEVKKFWGFLATACVTITPYDDCAVIYKKQ